MSIGSYRSHEPESQLLKDGDNVVSLRSFVECTSFDDVRFVPGVGLSVVGQKEMTQLWNTPTTQYAILVGNDEGSMVHRLNEGSFLHWDSPDFTQAMRNSGLYTEVGGYVCQMIDGKLDRVADPKGLEKCKSIITKFLYAIAGESNVDGDKAIDSAIATKKPFIVTVKSKPYQGKMQKSIAEFRKIGEPVQAVSALPVDDGDLSS